MMAGSRDMVDQAAGYFKISKYFKATNALPAGGTQPSKPQLYQTGNAIFGLSLHQWDLVSPGNDVIRYRRAF
jgi:hypothetical protein